MNKFFKNKKALVTGGTGLIGRQVVDLLVQMECSVSVISLDKIKINPKANYFNIDLLNFEECINATKNIDFVFHLAGVKGSIEVTKTRPASFFVPLLMMNTNILEASRLNKVKRLVYTSSIGAYHSSEIFREENNNFNEQPMDLYPGWAKRIAEMQIKSYKIEHKTNNFFIVRPCNVYGPGDNFDPNNAMVIPSLMSRIYNKEDPLLVWGDGSAIRDFAFSKDVAYGIIQTMYHGTGKFDFINLGSGKGISIEELIKTLNKVVKFNYEFDHSKSSGFKKRIMDISNAKKIIKYDPPTTLEKGLDITWKWFILNNKEYFKKKNYFK